MVFFPTNREEWKERGSGEQGTGFEPGSTFPWLCDLELLILSNVDL